jgi:hypothetical protein
MDAALAAEPRRVIWTERDFSVAAPCRRIVCVENILPGAELVLMRRTYCRIHAVLALVAHAMIPVALEEGGSLVVLPTVAGFLFALYLALAESFV